MGKRKSLEHWEKWKLKNGKMENLGKNEKWKVGNWRKKSHLKWQQQNLACFHVCMLAVVIIGCLTIFTSAWAFGPSFYQFDGLRKRLQQRCHQDLCQWLQQTFQYPSPLSLTAHSLEYTCERVSGFPSSFHSNCVCCGSMKRNQLRQLADNTFNCLIVGLN